jgi:predicted small lipoprotein YifL
VTKALEAIVEELKSPGKKGPLYYPEPKLQDKQLEVR